MEKNFDNKEKLKEIEAEIEKLDLYERALLMHMDGNTKAAIELLDIEIEKSSKSEYWTPGLNSYLWNLCYYPKTGYGIHSYDYHIWKEDLKKKFNTLYGFDRYQ